MLIQQVCVKQAKGRWGRVESNGLECPSSYQLGSIIKLALRFTC